MVLSLSDRFKRCARRTRVKGLYGSGYMKRCERSWGGLWDTQRLHNLRDEGSLPRPQPRSLAFGSPN